MPVSARVTAGLKASSACARCHLQSHALQTLTQPTSLQNSLDITLKPLNLDSGEQAMLSSSVVRQEESINHFCFMLRTGSRLEEKQACSSWSDKPNGHFFCCCCFSWNSICHQRVNDRLQSGSLAGSVSKMNKTSLSLQGSQLMVLWPVIKSRISSETRETLEALSIRMLYAVSRTVAQCLKTFLRMEEFRSVSPASTSYSFHPSLPSLSLPF